MKTAEEYLYKWMNDSDIDVPTIIEEIISDAYEDIEKEKEISNWIAKYLTLEESQLQPLPDEWWAKLKEGDKFNGDGRTWTFHELLVTTEEGKVFDLNEISPYTAPTAAEARAKLSDEEYEALKKHIQEGGR